MRKLRFAVGALALLVALAFSTHAYAQDAVRTGTIVTIDATAMSFNIKTGRGESKIVATKDTVVLDGDKKLTFADLKAGDSVKVTGVRKGDDVEAKEVAKQPKAE